MDLAIESRDGFVYAKLTGRVSLAPVLNGFKKACDAAVDRGVDRILVDCSGAEGDLSTVDRYELGSVAADYYQSKSLSFKVAAAGHPPLVNGFAALVARDHGVAAVTFEEVKDAIDWLNRFRDEHR